jgi:hypothetical protein
MVVETAIRIPRTFGLLRAEAGRAAGAPPSAE